MKSIKRWRYYCDHCKKSGGSKYHMAKHEKSCVKNPARYCGFCEVSKGSYDGDYLVKMVSYLKSNIIEMSLKNVDPYLFNSEPDGCFYDLKEKENIITDILREMSGNCPACILSAIAQSGHAYLFSFNFKDEKEIFWNNNKPEEPNYY